MFNSHLSTHLGGVGWPANATHPPGRAKRCHQRLQCSFSGLLPFSLYRINEGRIVEEESDMDTLKTVTVSKALDPWP